jgi:hypothetical protein
MIFPPILLLTGVLSLSRTVTGKQLPCNADDIPVPEYFGVKVTGVTAKEVHGKNLLDAISNETFSNYTQRFLGYTGFPELDLSLLAFEKNPLDFCNVTVTYTHPGQGDSVNVYVWMPLEAWNGNFLGQGGGGW